MCSRGVARAALESDRMFCLGCVRSKIYESVDVNRYDTVLKTVYGTILFQYFIAGFGQYLSSRLCHETCANVFIVTVDCGAIIESGFAF